MIDSEIREFGKDIYWDSGREILGAGLYFLRSNEVEGLIYLTCFSCGVDSMIEPLIRHRAAENGKTLYLCLMIDEHTGATGVLTRMEAFIDLLTSFGILEIARTGKVAISKGPRTLNPGRRKP